ncbi:MAG TPA: hypothetical protein VFW05_07755, partial [Verrucomicrobiae bacterium]|nr:hypothetical protein [Verrucomicrobiae bacterium]
SWAVAMNSSSCLGLRFPSAMPAGRFHAQTGFKIPSPRKEFFNGLLGYLVIISYSSLFWFWKRNRKNGASAQPESGNAVTMVRSTFL